MIYFDNAATSYPKPPRVAEAVLRAIDSFGNPSRGAHAFALTATRVVEHARTLAASLFNCRSASRIAFTKNVTEALNIAINSIDGHIVATEAEHNSVLRPLYRKGDYSIVPVDGAGRYSAEDVAGRCRPDTRAVVVGHASNLTGNIAPLEALGRLCRERDIALIVDAAQTAGLVEIDMDALGVDALCFTGHKSLYGLQGTGGICLSERFTPRPLIVGGSGSRTFEKEQPSTLPGLLEAGTVNSPGIAGLSAGMAYVLEQGPAELRRRADALAGQFLRGLDGIKDVRLYGDIRAERRLPIVTLNLGELDSAEVAAELADSHGIAVRAGTHCAPLLHERFGTVRQGAVRFSFSHANTGEEVDIALAALRSIQKALS